MLLEIVIFFFCICQSRLLIFFSNLVCAILLFILPKHVLKCTKYLTRLYGIYNFTNLLQLKKSRSSCLKWKVRWNFSKFSSGLRFSVHFSTSFGSQNNKIANTPFKKIQESELTDTKMNVTIYKSSSCLRF